MGRSIVLVIIILSLAGCSGTDKETDISINTPDSGLKFRLATELNAESKIWEISNLFKQEIEKSSPEHGIREGEINVVFYDQGMIGTERQLLENCYFGIVEMVQINSSVITTIDPAYSLLDLPYLFTTEEHHQRVLYGEIGQKFLARLKNKKLLGLGFYSTGFRNMFYKQKGGEDCIETPEDLQGMKIRVMESPVMINAINALGATATPIPHSELFQGLKTGVVDGAENSARIFISYKYYETGCNCFTLTEHFANQHILVVNEPWFNSLEPKYRDRISEVSRIITPLFDSVWAETTKQSMEEMMKNNVVINVIEDKQPFIDRADRFINEYLENYPELPLDLLGEIRSKSDNYNSNQEK